MAKISGYKVIATCSQSKEAIARATGADAVIVFPEKAGSKHSDYAAVDIAKLVQEITGGQGVKAVRDFAFCNHRCRIPAARDMRLVRV